MIEEYQITQGVEKVDRENFSCLSHDSIILVHSMKLDAGRFRSDKKKVYHKNITEP